VPRENAQDKGKRYLLEGRVVIVHVDRDSAAAVVRGDGHLHHVAVHGPAWTCTCPARTRCSHQYAVGHVIAIDHPEGHQ
jgi:uncharacterized Zn finger protein